MRLFPLNVGTRIHLVFGLLLAILATLLLLSTYTMKRLDKAAPMNHDIFHRVGMLGDLRAMLMQLQASQRTYALTGAHDALMTARRQREQIRGKVEELRRLSAHLPQQLQRVNEVEQVMNAYITTVIDPALLLRQKVDAGKASHKQLHDFFESDPGRTHLNPILHLFDTTGTSDDAVVTARQAEAQTWRELSRSILLYGGGLSVLAAILCIYALTRNATRPLAVALRRARRARAGGRGPHLLQQRRDEAALLLTSLQTMNDNLLRMVHDVRQSAATIAMASEQIASGSLDLSSCTERQAATLQQSVASVGALALALGRNAEQACQASELAHATSIVAMGGGGTVDQLASTMEAIHIASHRIIVIIEVINNIAVQTHILALNAAVAAARTGENGRDFTVVATEVRALGQRAAGAANEIKALIDDAAPHLHSTSPPHIRPPGQLFGDHDDAPPHNAVLMQHSAAAAQSLRLQAQRLQAAVSVFRTVPVPIRPTAAPLSLPAAPPQQ